MLMLAFATSAAPETYKHGPFIISFDMNTTLNHTVQIAGPLVAPTSATWLMQIKNDNNTTAIVSIIEFNNLTDSTLTTNMDTIGLSTALQGFYNNITYKAMKIDGKDGFIVSGRNTRNMRLFRASYWIDSNKCACGPVSVGKINVAIGSTYPEDITLKLLNSLHVQRTLQSA
jgi:hypothetical protein